MADAPPDDLNATILARIDRLTLDLVRQLVEHSDLLHSPTTATSPTVAASTASPSATSLPGDEAGQRPKKRQKATLPAATPLSLLRFDGDAGTAGVRSGVCFPTNSERGVRRFAQHLRVLELVQANLLRGTLVTKRDIFYQSLHLFSSQSASDRVIEQVVSMLGCTSRAQLGIVASPRGLVSGPLTLHSPGSGSVRCEERATLIPPDLSSTWSVTLSCTDPSVCREQGHTVLVVEKEAVFKHLLQQQPLMHGGELVLVTGKGYPDYATRALLTLLSSAKCERGGEARVVGLFDGDPYGVDIHRHYTMHACEVEWLGIDLADFTQQSNTEEENQQLVPLRNDERAKAVRLLRTFWHQDREQVPLWRGILTEMLLSGYKVEIEAAYSFHMGGREGLRGYLDHKLSLAP